MSPAVADAKAVGRVQGLQSHFSELTLRDGRKLAIELGGVTPTPTLNRGIEESSSLNVGIYDPDLRLLDLTLLAEKWDASVDGLNFRYLGHKKTGKNFSITLEDRDVALLRELKGPKKALRDKVTRAEFVKSLVEEVRPKLDFYCPQLHVKQPIESPSKAKQAKEDAKANRSAGLSAAEGLTVKGEKATQPQIELGDRVLRDAEHEHAPFSAMVALMAACIIESELQNLTGGDGSSSGVLQVTAETAASSGIDARNVEQVVSQFLHEGFTGQGGAIEHAREGMEPGQSAQLCQGSAFGSRYGAHIQEAREWVEAFLGGTGSSSEKVFEPDTFEVGKKETYWDAIQRLAKEVNWRAFIVASRFFLIDEVELARGMVRLAIKRKPGESAPVNPGIIDVDYDYNKNKPVTEATVIAFADSWKAPPGAVVTLEGYGAASIGFGDAPPGKGQKVGLSSNRNARTGVGRGRYIVSKISSSLGGMSGRRQVTAILKKPTTPLPEKPASTKSIPGSGGGVAGEMGVLEGTPEDIVNQVVDYAHSHGFPNVTRESVRAANASHGPTVSGGRSNHQGPPDQAWAADISNGVLTPQEDALADAIAEAFGIPWDGSGLVTHVVDGYQLQLIYRAEDHDDHVHFGCQVV